MKNKKLKIIISISAAVVFAVVVFLYSIFIPKSCSKTPPENGAGYTEKFDRGLVVTRDYRGGKDCAVLTWRYLPTDEKVTAFDIYRKDEDGTEKKLNETPLTGATYYEDRPIDKTEEYTYRVVANKEVAAKSDTYTLKANTPKGCFYTIPIRDGIKVKNVWVGDLNGDGEYDFVIDRVTGNEDGGDEDATDSFTGEQSIEAYLSDGTFLWSVHLGKNSTYKYNIEPSATTISVGHWDGVNVYDLDGDGKAEVYIRIANGVTFGDGTFFEYDDDKTWTGYNSTEYDLHQWIARLDGMSGKLIDKAPIPDEYIDDGPMAAQFGVGFLDGKKPSLVAVMKNRKDDKTHAFQMQICAYSVVNGSLIMDWQWKAKDESISLPEGHQFRICDVDFDGKDEILEIGFCLNGDGTLRYTLAPYGVNHGDRFYVGKFNSGDNFMSGYGITQLNDEKLWEYCYNASTGEMLWRHYGESVVDVGRGCAADIDPTVDGVEVWSYSGIYNAKTDELLSDIGTTMWPDINIQWDGDLLYESCHGNNNSVYIEQWDYENKSVSRVDSLYSIYNQSVGHYASADTTKKYPLFVGDIIGDWREEVIVIDYESNCLVIYTTQQETEYRMPTLAADRTYRNWMTVKGYKQGPTTSFYFGADMDIKKTFPNV